MRCGVSIKPCVLACLLNHVFSECLLNHAFSERLINHAFRNAYYTMRFGAYAQCDSYLHRANLTGPNLRFGVSIKTCVSECLLNHVYSECLLIHAFSECLINREFQNAYYAMRFGVYAKCGRYCHRVGRVRRASNHSSTTP